jgi:tRNA threonylcarbamoyl adenosine modification protein (Sua5/YciO/YrdC/YwlC family)
VSRFFDCSDPDERERGLARAASALRRGELVVLPTDTVYGIGCDAFASEAVAALLEAKGRGRDMPVPVLVGSPRVLDGLASGVTQRVRDLVEAFWPGALTLVCQAQPTLTWDLGDSRGTVAIRMPLHPVAIELLREVGPMAVSSANRSGHPPATTVDDAADQLGDSVSVYLDGGPSGEAVPSSILDVTGALPVLLRAGAVDIDALRAVVPDLEVPA